MNQFEQNFSAQNIVSAQPVETNEDDWKDFLTKKEADRLDEISGSGPLGPLNPMEVLTIASSSLLGTLGLGIAGLGALGGFSGTHSIVISAFSAAVGVASVAGGMLPAICRSNEIQDLKDNALERREDHSQKATPQITTLGLG